LASFDFCLTFRSFRASSDSLIDVVLDLLRAIEVSLDVGSVLAAHSLMLIVTLLSDCSGLTPPGSRGSCRSSGRRAAILVHARTEIAHRVLMIVDHRAHVFLVEVRRRSASTACP
jgi:hypothetical protein